MSSGEFRCCRCGVVKDHEEVGGTKNKHLICLSCDDLETQDKLFKEKKGFSRRRKDSEQL